MRSCLSIGCGGREPIDDLISNEPLNNNRKGDGGQGYWIV